MKKANDKSKSPYLKQIILSSCCAVLSLVVLAVATAAWFARNDRVKATNVNIKVDPEASLVISKNPDNPAAREWLPEISFATPDDQTAILTPISHDKDGDGARLSTLHYCKLPSKIGRDTGYKTDETDDSLVFGAVTDATDGTRTFYKDVYTLIASENKAFTNQTLTATMYLTDADGNRDADFHNQFNATSVDFYVCSFAENGDINVPAYSPNNTLTIKQTAADPGASVTLFTATDIPVTTAPIPVLMRFYFDGALSDDTEPQKAYVRTSNVDLSKINITVEFTTADTTS